MNTLQIGTLIALHKVIEATNLQAGAGVRAQTEKKCAQQHINGFHEISLVLGQQPE
jgi:hypothetical protein